jgi:hypothetical protein
MTDKNNPAFPVVAQYNVYSTGMDLRDWFAGMALQGLIAGCLAGNNSGFTVRGNVVAAYEYADAMLEARNAK